jgi:hypothetical protein
MLVRTRNGGGGPVLDDNTKGTEKSNWVSFWNQQKMIAKNNQNAFGMQHLELQ